jgi:hypothetical protein
MIGNRILSHAHNNERYTILRVNSEWLNICKNFLNISNRLDKLHSSFQHESLHHLKYDGYSTTNILFQDGTVTSFENDVKQTKWTLHVELKQPFIVP